MPRNTARWLARIAYAEPEELRAVLWSFGYFFFLLASYFILRPLRDEMGIAAGRDNLQWLFTATFFVTLVAVPLYAAAVARLPRRRLIPRVYRCFAAILLAFFAAFTLASGDALVLSARAFFVWISVFNLFVVSVFWGVMADLWRREQGERLFGLIAAGGVCGILLGAIPAWPHSRSWGYGPSGIVGVILIVLLILLLMGRI